MTANLGAQIVLTQFCAPAPLVLLVIQGLNDGIIEIVFYGVISGYSVCLCVCVSVCLCVCVSVCLCICVCGYIGG